MFKQLGGFWHLHPSINIRAAPDWRKDASGSDEQTSISRRPAKCSEERSGRLETIWRVLSPNIFAQGQISQKQRRSVWRARCLRNCSGVFFLRPSEGLSVRWVWQGWSGWTCALACVGLTFCGFCIIVSRLASYQSIVIVVQCLDQRLKIILSLVYYCCMSSCYLVYISVINVSIYYQQCINNQ